MKNNTSQTKTFLEQAIRNIPEDNSLAEVRYHIRAALGKLEDVEKKRMRREENSIRREQVLENLNKVLSNNPMATIRMIDEEIAKEKARLEDIKVRRTIKNDLEDDQNLYG